MDDLNSNYKTFYDSDEEEVIPSDCNTRVMILRHATYWLTMPVIMIITILFVTMNYRIGEILLASGCLQTIVTIGQIVMLYLNHSSYTDDEVHPVDSITYGSICMTSFIWYVINVVISSVKIKMLAWYVLLIVHMPSIIWVLTATIYGVYKLYPLVYSCLCTCICSIMNQIEAQTKDRLLEDKLLEDKLLEDKLLSEAYSQINVDEFDNLESESETSQKNE